MSMDQSEDIRRTIDNHVACRSALLKAVHAVWGIVGTDAVGMRLIKDDDYPYYCHLGFSPEFISCEESVLSRKEGLGDGCSRLECMCGCVLEGKVEYKRSSHTLHGSFFINSAADFPARVEDERGQVFRRRFSCLEAGYHSIALVPLKRGGLIFGLLQFCDRSAGVFSAELIAGVERVASLVADVLCSVLRNARLNQELSGKLRVLERVADTGIGGTAQTTVGAETRLQRLHDFLAEAEDLTKLIPICCYCKRVRTGDGHWEDVDSYISACSQFDFTHTYCPDCIARNYGGMYSGTSG